MALSLSVAVLLKRVSVSGAAQAALPAFANSASVDACQPSCSYRHYASQDGESESQHGGDRRSSPRGPMRYGSKLALRDPARFRRMQAILGYPKEDSVDRVERVTISTLQTMKYLMNGPENQDLLQDMAAYKVTTLNRELLPLHERTEAFLSAKPAVSGSVPSFLVKDAARRK
ncbi:hypothetical protein Agub_g9055 [Astrephomene gubernaculifera]|uniref:Uncharacterized protein n=1 Tax=Astrephomene gubernaculifera TaxID=47775 RepID=A0AAD3DSQ8_9CHLO|nr:hypothetical protein Agub_g9055 [Astrephomene gubernaculifera]